MVEALAARDALRQLDLESEHAGLGMVEAGDSKLLEELNDGRC